MRGRTESFFKENRTVWNGGPQGKTEGPGRVGRGPQGRRKRMEDAHPLCFSGPAARRGSRSSGQTLGVCWALSTGFWCRLPRSEPFLTPGATHPPSGFPSCIHLHVRFIQSQMKEKSPVSAFGFHTVTPSSFWVWSSKRTQNCTAEEVNQTNDKVPGYRGT